jgi:hypothetical protein
MMMNKESYKTLDTTIGKTNKNITKHEKDTKTHKPNGVC